MTTRMARFDVVEVREYPVVLSDNPACQYGPSVELGWEYNISNVSSDSSKNNGSDGEKGNQRITVSAYEKGRRGKRRTTASKPSKLYLSQVRRESTLKEANYTEDELKAAIRAKSKARRQRSVSNVLMNPLDKIQSTIKAWRRNRKLKRALRNLKKKQNKEPTFEHSAIYQGWWLPFSGDLF